MEAGKKPKVSIKMLSGKPGSASAVIEIDGQVSVITNFDIVAGITPAQRERLLIDKAFAMQGKQRPVSDDAAAFTTSCVSCFCCYDLNQSALQDILDNKYMYECPHCAIITEYQR